MTIHAPRLTRRSWLLLGVLSLAATYACADGVAGPRPSPSTPQLDLEASGVYVSTLWRPTDSGATYLGGITGRAEVRGSGAALRVATADEHALATRPVSPLPLADPDGAGTRSQRIIARTIDLPSKDGKRRSLRLATDPRNDGRPAMAAIVYEDGRPVAISEFSYAREGKGWRIVRSRSTMLDAAGKATLVVDNDLSRVLGGAGRSALPDAVAANHAADMYEEQTDDGPIKCAAERLAVLSASASWVSAAAGLAALVTATCTVAPQSCTLAIVAAQAALVAADVALGQAIGNLQRCLDPPPPPPSVIAPGGSSGPGWTEWCEYLVSYENGVPVSSTPLRCWMVQDE